MADSNVTPRDLALHHLQAALKSGIRGRNRGAVQFAIEVIEDDGQSDLRDVHYRNLRAGETLSDPKRPGLRLRANRTGKVWIYRYKIDEKQREYQFATYPATELAEARKQWKELREMRLSGQDPAGVGNNSHHMTCKQLAHQYVIEYAKPNKRTWVEDESMLERDFLKLYREKPAVEITRDDIEAMLAAIIERNSPRAAEKTLACVRKVFNQAIKKRWVSGLESNPCKFVELDKRKPQSAHLNESEIKSFLHNLPTASMPDEARQALRLQFLTVSRIGEICGFPWVELDLEHGVWNLPADRSKNKEAHRVMLSSQALELLKARKTLSGKSKYVFPWNTSSGHLRPDSIASWLSDNRNYLGVPNKFTTHGLRHTALTQLASMGCGKELRDRLSNHKDSSVDSIYQHYEHDSEAKEWLQKWADRMDVFSMDSVAMISQKESERGSK